MIYITVYISFIIQFKFKFKFKFIFILTILMIRGRSQSQLNSSEKQNHQSIFQQLNSNFSSLRLGIDIQQIQKMVTKMLIKSEKKTEQIIKHLQRQLRNKVGKQEFTSSLASKVSYSQLGTLLSMNAQNQNQYKNTKPQNKSRKSTKTFLEASSILKEEQRQKSTVVEQVMAYCQKQAKQFQTNAEKIYKIKYQSMQQLLGRCKQRFQQMWQLKEQALKNICSLENNSRHKQAQLEQLIFQKAERSELNKMFKLQDLMLIQMEQMKNRVKQSEKCIQVTNLAQQKFKQQLNLKIEQLIALDKVQKKQIRHQMKKSLQKLQGCMNKAFDLIEAQGSCIQEQNVIKFNRFDTIIKQKCQNMLSQRLALTYTQHEQVKQTNRRIKQAFEQLEYRIDQFQLKQKQVHVIGMQEQILRQQVRRQLNSFSKKIQLIDSCLKQKAQEIFDENMKLKGSQIVDQIKVMNQKVCERVTSALDQTVKKDYLDQQLLILRQQQTVTEQFDMKIAQKINQIDKKQQNIWKSKQVYQVRNAEAIEKLVSQLKDRVKFQQFKKIISKLATAEELRQGILNLEQKMEKKIQKYQINQQSLNQALCSQNIVAKYIWSEGQLKGGNLIPWDNQIINTLPENFICKKQETVIMITKSGFYRIQMGFYSKKKPSIQIIVNGQTVISAVNNSSYVLHHSSGKLKQVGQNDVFSVTGITLIDFFMLPQNSRIAVSYVGQFLGEGFISIQRL